MQLGREGCRTSLKSRENEKAKTRSSPWRVGAQERVKPSYDCDLVFEDVEGAPDPVRGEPRTGRPTGCPTNAGPTTRWDAVCVSTWIYAYADITLNLRGVQISPSICVVADDEYDRNHLSPSHVLLQLLNAELLQESIRETPPRTPRCVARKSPRPICGNLCSLGGCDAYVCVRLL